MRYRVSIEIRAALKVEAQYGKHPLKLLGMVKDLAFNAKRSEQD